MKERYKPIQQELSRIIPMFKEGARRLDNLNYKVFCFFYPPIELKDNCPVETEGRYELVDIRYKVSIPGRQL